MNLKLVLSSNEFFIKCPASANNVQQERFKVVIGKAIFTFRIIELIGDAVIWHTAILEQEKSAIILHKTVQVKHLYIPHNNTSYNFETVFTDNLPDLIVVALVADTDFSGHYNKNLFNFTAFGVIRIELKPNGISVLR